MNKETKINETGPGETPNPYGDLHVIASVTFGNPRDGMGPCVGKGVCKLRATDLATKVKFTLSRDLETLTFTFNRDELKMNQPDQINYFDDPSKTYQFDSEFILDDQTFVDLGVLKNASILPQSPTAVSNDTDGNIILDVVYSHD